MSSVSNTPQVVIVPLAVFDKSLAANYLLLSGRVVVSNSVARFATKGEYACVWADVDSKAESSSHRLLDIIASKSNQRECVELSIDGDVTHLAVWDHSGLAIAETIPSTNPYDLLFYTRSLCKSDPFITYKLVFGSDNVDDQTVRLFGTYYSDIIIAH